MSSTRSLRPSKRSLTLRQAHTSGRPQIRTCCGRSMRVREERAIAGLPAFATLVRLRPGSRPEAVCERRREPLLARREGRPVVREDAELVALRIGHRDPAAAVGPPVIGDLGGAERG